MLVDKIAKAVARFVDKRDQANTERHRTTAGYNANLKPSNPRRHAMYPGGTAEARRVASLRAAERRPFDHAAERRSARHRSW